MSDAITVRIAIVGDERIGKSSLINRYCHNIFFNHYRPTLGIDFSFKHIVDHEIGDVKAQFWDMSGRRNFKFFCNGYLLDAHGIIIAFDVTNNSSIENAFGYLNEIKNKFRDNNRRLPKFCFIGLKADHTNKWYFDLTKRCEYELYCTSAKENIGVSDSLNAFIMECVNDRMADALLPPNQLIDTEDVSEDEKSEDDLKYNHIELSAEDELSDVRTELAEMKAERTKEIRQEERTLLLRRIVQLGDKEAVLLKMHAKVE